MASIVIVNYGMGNLRSVQKAFERINIPAIFTSDINLIQAAEKLILPGVGHFKNGMTQLNDLGMIEVLKRKVLEEKTPILGICLGMQLFTKHSEEGDCEGLGYFDAVTVKFRETDKRLKIPHMGWNNVVFTEGSIYNEELNQGESYYFVHSYHVNCQDNSNILGTTDYGYTFTSAIQKDNITGFQFHPEKSFTSGLRLLRKFCS
jgi:imidazole glycerol-phosphate synthase subunit HisH